MRYRPIHIFPWVYKSFEPFDDLHAEILKLAKGDHDTQLSKNTQSEQDTYEMQVRAANIGKTKAMSYE